MVLFVIICFYMKDKRYEAKRNYLTHRANNFFLALIKGMHTTTKFFPRQITGKILHHGPGGLKTKTHMLMFS